MALSRRDFLERLLAVSAAAGVTALASPWAHAIGEKSSFRIGHLQLGKNWNPHPTALGRMAWEIAKRTSIDVEREPKIVTPASKSLHATPFLYLTGDRELEIPPPRDIEKLRRFLTFGGFLLIDSAEGSTGGAFDHSVRRLVEAIFPPPSSGLELIPGDHVVYKSFYLIDRPVGRLAISPVMEGITRDDRLVIAYLQNDLGGAFARDNFGNYEMQCIPGGERQRQLAFRMVVNLVMYALCLDYKSDQVHVEFIMRRRRWRPEDDIVPPRQAPTQGPKKTP